MRRCILTCGALVALVAALCISANQAQAQISCPSQAGGSSSNLLNPTFYVTASTCTTTDPGSGVLVTASINTNFQRVGFTLVTPTSVSTTGFNCTGSGSVSGNQAYYTYYPGSTCTTSITTSGGGAMSFTVFYSGLYAASITSISITPPPPPPAPTVTGLSASGGSTAGGNSVVITGTNFNSITAVRFGTTSATTYIRNSATSITALVPAAQAEGVVDVTVTTSAGTSPTSSADQYTYYLAPTISAAFNPTSIVSGGTSTLLISLSNPSSTVTLTGVAIAAAALPANLTGSNLQTTCNGTPSLSNGSIGLTGASLAPSGFCSLLVTVTSTVPNTYSYTTGAVSASGPVSITGTTASTSTPLTVQGVQQNNQSGGAPTVSGIIPKSGPATGGTVVTVTGTNFTGATAVKFGGFNAATFNVTSATQIVATSPPGMLGTVDVTVTTTNGTSATSAADQFSYTADSVKLRSLQTAITPIVAQTSVQIITTTIDNAISEGFSGGGPLVNPNGSGVRFNFAGDPEAEPTATAGRTGRSTADDPFRNAGSAFGRTANPRPQQDATDPFAALAYADAAKTPPKRFVEPREWLGWAEISGATLSRWGMPGALAGTSIYGNQVNVVAGLTRRLTPDLLVGAFGGWETFDYRFDALQGRLKGDGATVGSYVGWRLTQQIRFDAAVGYSVIGFDGSAGTATASFDGTRWLVSTGLTGSYQSYGFLIEPSAKVYALWETENRYTDSLGTLQPDRKFSTGRASGGVKLGYPVAWSPTVTLIPNIAVYGDYYFNADSAGALAGTLLAGWSARAAGGVTAQFGDGAQVALATERSGIGGNFSLWTYRARASVPFNAK